MKILQILGLLLVLAPSTGICDGYFRCGSWLVSSDTPVSDRGSRAAMIVKVVDGKVASIHSEDDRPDENPAR